MYAQLIIAHMLPTKLEQCATAFSHVIVPTLSRKRGFKSIYVMKDMQDNTITALIMWETHSDTQINIEGYIHQLLSKEENVLASQPQAETLKVILRA